VRKHGKLMHERLSKPDFWDRHVASELARVSRFPAANRPFRSGRKESPVRRFARDRFRESVANMLAGAYTGRGETE